MQKGPPTPKGFRDILPDLAKKRRQVINKIVQVLAESGFVPIETPTIEFAQTLKGKYGEEERLIYEFKDRGGRDLALRYDLTVPLARFIANNQNLIAKGPFRRYQIGQVFRGENPQAGRWREFTQFDFDSVGSESLEEDAKIVTIAIKSARILGLETAQMAINDRNVFANIHIDIIRAIDKLHKVGREELEKDLESKGFSQKDINVLGDIDKTVMSPNTKQLFELLEKQGLKQDRDFFFDPTLARGLDYYTGTILELKPTGDPASLSIGAGGRYDNLIGMFVYPERSRGAKKQIPAVGLSFGLDRLIECLP
ncbi:histidine--tRNA ligase family protein [Candidatus Curtissbacteria bacterium]|nr:histidine--tRNA ligase family protein [Candidatus Curtissbacteria bacterium]